MGDMHLADALVLFLFMFGDRYLGGGAADQYEIVQDGTATYVRPERVFCHFDGDIFGASKRAGVDNFWPLRHV